MTEELADLAEDALKMHGPMSLTNIRDVIEKHRPDVLKEIDEREVTQVVALNEALQEDGRFAKDDCMRYVLTA